MTYQFILPLVVSCPHHQVVPWEEGGRWVGGRWKEGGRWVKGGWEEDERRVGEGWEEGGRRVGGGWKVYERCHVEVQINGSLKSLRNSNLIT